MIPRPDFASKIRKHRKKKKGLINHKELVFQSYIERRNSYNEIVEKVHKRNIETLEELSEKENENISVKINVEGFKQKRICNF